MTSTTLETPGTRRRSVPGVNDSIEILRGCGWLAGLPDDALRALAGMASTRRYPAGASLLREGQPCPGVFVLGTGSVRIERTAASGKTHLLELVRAGGSFAEVAVLRGIPCPASAVAAENVVCALLPRERFRARLDADHALCLALLQSVTGWARGLVKLLDDLTLRDATGRVASRLLALHVRAGGEPFALPLRRKDLASQLNLTSETFSRIMRRLLDDGVIAEDASRRIRVPDADRLAALAAGDTEPR